MQHGMPPLRAHIAQRLQHKSTAVHQRMRQCERVGVQHTAVAVDQVDVDEAVGIHAVVRFGSAPHLPFDVLCGVEQLLRREVCIGKQHAVGEGVGTIEAPRFGTVHGAFGHDATNVFGQQERGATQIVGAVAQVGTERNDGTHQAPISAA